MMLYDVFYKNSVGFDRDTALPKASMEIDRAENKNWDGHVKRPVKLADGTVVWQDSRKEAK